MKNYYEILGVAEDADETTIKKAYRKLAMEYHPDRNPNNTEAEKKFKEIAEAYNTIGDTDKRQEYDVKRKMPQGMPGFGPNIHGINIDDFLRDMGFGDMFGRQRSNRPQAPQPGQSLKATFTLDLEDVLSATIKKIKLNRMKRCGSCGGSGADSSPDAVQTCERCKGSGMEQRSMGQMWMQTTCQGCLGEGKIIKKVCQTCHRHGFVRTTEEVEIRIPAGVKTGDTLRVPGKGHESRNMLGTPGDLFIDIEVREHKVFQRDGIEIYQKVEIPFTLAVLGGKVEIPILSNTDIRKREVIIDPGMPGGRTIHYSQMGLPHPRSQRRGDMIVEYEIEVPKVDNLTKKQRHLLEKLHRSFAPES